VGTGLPADTDAGDDEATDGDDETDGKSDDADDGDPDNDGGDSPGSGGTGSAPMETTGAEGSGDSVLEACLDIAANECEACGCNSCLDPLYACEEDAGCVAMRSCAQQSGCTDTISCYEACQSVIDQHGGAFGPSAALAGALSECMEASCAVCFS
jgi:hypothetical protein